MASTAPAQSNPAQPQNGNRSPHVNGGQGDQQFKQGGRNPSHKKGWATKRDKEGAGFNGNPDQPRGERPQRRREREENDANGSPVAGRSEEHRERPRGKGRGSREAQNANGNSPHTNGNHVKAEASASHTDETKAASKPDHIDGQVEQVLVDDLREKYPQVPVEKIVRTIRRNHYDPEKSLNEIEALQQKQPSPWIDVVKGKQAKAPSPADQAPVQPVAQPAAQPGPVGRNRDKRREESQSPQHPQQHQQQAQQQAQQQPPQHQAQQPQQPQQPQQQVQQQAQQQVQHQAQQHQQHPQHPHYSKRQQQQQQQQQQQYVPLPQHHQVYQHPHQYQQPQNYPQYHQHYQQVPPQPHPQLQHQEQLLQQQEQQLQEQQQLAQQHALQPYQQPYPQPEVKGEDILNSLSKVIERELAEVQKKTEMLASLKGQLDLINNADKDHRSQLEEKRAQLEADRANFTEQLRIVENELGTVKLLIKNAEDDKRRKIEDLYRNFQSNGVLAITNS